MNFLLWIMAEIDPDGIYTLRGHEWHFLIKRMPEVSQPLAGG